MHNDEATKVADRPLTPLLPERQEPVDGAAFTRWWVAVVQATANGAAERRQEA